MGGGRALSGGSSAEFALRRLGLCRCLWRCKAAGNTSTEGQFCNLHVHWGEESGTEVTIKFIILITLMVIITAKIIMTIPITIVVIIINNNNNNYNNNNNNNDNNTNNKTLSSTRWAVYEQCKSCMSRAVWRGRKLHFIVCIDYALTVAAWLRSQNDSGGFVRCRHRGMSK